MTYRIDSFPPQPQLMFKTIVEVHKQSLSCLRLHNANLYSTTLITKSEMVWLNNEWISVVFRWILVYSIAIRLLCSSLSQTRWKICWLVFKNMTDLAAEMGECRRPNLDFVDGTLNAVWYRDIILVTVVVNHSDRYLTSLRGGM